jgi:hypothetical protein
MEVLELLIEDYQLSGQTLLIPSILEQKIA